MNETLLSLAGVQKKFGGLYAVNNVSFDVAKGSITALIGPNGAGKTTLINLITGVLRQSAGSISLNGKEVSRMSAAERVRAGMSRSYQTPQMIRGLSALENVTVGADLFGKFSILDVFYRPWAVRADNRQAQESARQALAKTGLPEALWDYPAEALSYGDQRRVEIARSLAQKPQILLLDEPAAGLNPTETEELGHFLRRLSGEGLTILLVEHDMPLIMSIADKIVVVNFGQGLAEGTPAEIQKNEAVIAAYLGADIEEEAPAAAAENVKETENV